jgi:NAD(P)-dependent dehydrogenase (short-subunit alcohol dehydrogenase family)
MAGGNLNRMKKLVIAVLFGRAGQSGEVANAIAFLTSGETSLVTGQTLSLSGGQTIAS